MSEQRAAWICPLRMTTCRSVLTPDEQISPQSFVYNELVCLRDQCMIWNQFSQNCAIWAIPDRLHDLFEALETIAIRTGGAS